MSDGGGRIVHISGPTVIARGLDSPAMYNLVRVGTPRLLGEIIRVDGDEVTVYARDLMTPPAIFDRSEIATIRESKLSQMPGGLIDRLSPEELRDLVAYLVSGGDQESDVFNAPTGAEVDR